MFTIDAPETYFVSAKYDMCVLLMLLAYRITLDVFYSFDNKAIINTFGKHFINI